MTESLIRNTKTTGAMTMQNSPTSGLNTEENQFFNRNLVQLLNERFGDGRVILRSAADHELVRCGRDHGYITNCGYVTPEGQRLAAEFA